MMRSALLVAGCSVALFAGCSDNGPKDGKPPAKIDQPAVGMQETWIQVDGMSERLKII